MKIKQSDEEMTENKKKRKLLSHTMLLRRDEHLPCDEAPIHLDEALVRRDELLPTGAEAVLLLAHPWPMFLRINRGFRGKIRVRTLRVLTLEKE